MPKSERKVLIIGTGGTIASEPTVNGYAPLRTSSFYRRIRHHPQLSDLSHATPYPGQSGAASPLGHSKNGNESASTQHTFDDLVDTSVPTVQVGNNTLYPELRTPKLCGLSAVRYEILDLDRHMDSSEMTPKEWNDIAKLVEENWELYDGFIILSGTDTLAYTSSILSFLFTNVGKPILITGAQIPLSQSRSDGWDNILDSLVVAGVLDFAGVGVVFNHSVLQGNRATKISPNLFAAFGSPCCRPLIDMNVNITNPSLLPSRSPSLPPRLTELLTTPSVISVRIYPGITGASLSAQVNAIPDCKGVILCAYGSGNMPMSAASGMQEALREVVGKEIMVVVISQCAEPAVYPLYTQGRLLLDLGVLPGYDLTHEAAFAKLLWLVSRKDLSFSKRQRIFQAPVCGEMTVGNGPGGLVPQAE